MKKSKDLFRQLILKVGRTPDKAGQFTAEWTRRRLGAQTKFGAQALSRTHPGQTLCTLIGVNLGNFYLSNL
jgi:hypothetical protein